MDHPPSLNPCNDRPSVRLLDTHGLPRGHLSQRQAGRLLRAGVAELVFAVPPAVRLVISFDDYQSLPAGGDGKRGLFLQARRRALYGNVHFQGPDGTPMFNGDDEKALWYLNRGLVEVLQPSPPVLRFLFQPGGPGHHGDEYYLASKANHCVVCGAVEGLSRHHVVPRVYRRHLPAEVKSHSHHDVLLLCVPCHERYERAADALRAELGQECGVPPHGVHGTRDRQRERCIRLAWALRRHGSRIPPERREVILLQLGEWLGKWPLTDMDIEAIARREEDEESVAIEHGRQVVAGTPDIHHLVRRWREHFLNSMNPRFLPEHWDVGRPVQRRRASPPANDTP